MTMTRAEAICAATNILELAENLRTEFDDKFPDDYYESVTNQAANMQERIIENPQFEHVTENMEGWFRKTWDGLRRWDHQDEYNSDLFWGLAEIIMYSETNKSSKKGRENTDNEMPTHKTTTITTTTPAPIPIDISRIREERIAFVLMQIHSRNIRLIDKNIIRNVDIDAILRMTTSDRTRQLVESAFLIGKIAGIVDMASEVKDKMK